jgi:hypothetical protein
VGFGTVGSSFVLFAILISMMVLAHQTKDQAKLD